MRLICSALFWFMAFLAIPVGAETADWSATAPCPQRFPEIVCDTAIVIDGLFVAVKDEVLVCNTNSPDLPILGRCDLPGGTAYQARLIGGELYLACDSEGIVHVDLSDPAAPSATPIFNPEARIMDIGELENGTVAVGYDGEILVLEDLESGTPQLLAEHDLFAQIWEIATFGSIVYVVDSTGLVSLDLSVPESPVVSAPLEICPWYCTTAYKAKLCRVGPYLYAAIWCYSPGYYDGYEIQKLDLIEPMAPVILAQHALETRAEAIAVVGDHIVTTHSGRLVVSDAESLEVISAIAIPSSTGLEPLDDGLLVTSPEAGTTFIDGTDFTTIQPLGERSPGYCPFGGGRFGYRLWTVSSDPYGGSLRRFVVYDQSDPYNPVEYYRRDQGVEDYSNYTDRIILANGEAAVTYTGFWHDYGGDGWWESSLGYIRDQSGRRNLISTQGSISSVLVDNILWTWHGYSLDGQYHFQSFDLSTDSTTPIYHAEFDAAKKLYAVGDHLGFFTDSGLALHDVSDPVNPLVANVVAAPSDLNPRQRSAYLEGLFAVSTVNGIGVFSGPADGSPDLEWHTEIDLGTEPTLLILQDSYLLTRTDGPLRFFDLSDPSLPVELDPLNIDNTGHVVWHGETLYVGSANAIYAYDMSDPTLPTWIGQSWAGERSTYALASNGEYLFHNNLILPLHSAGVVGIPNDPEAGNSNRQTPNAAVIESISPNPFNPRTTVTYRLDRTATVQVTVHDLTGRRLATLVDRSEPAGQHTLTWLGTDDVGRDLPSGVYFVRVLAEGQADTRKVALIR